MVRRTSPTWSCAAALTWLASLSACGARQTTPVDVSEAFVSGARAALVWFERSGSSNDTALYALDLSAPTPPPAYVDALTDGDTVRVDVGSYSRTLAQLDLVPGALTPYRGTGRARTLAAPDLGRRRKTISVGDDLDGASWVDEGQPIPTAALQVTDERPCLTIEARSFPLVGVDGDPSMFVGLTLPDGRDGLLVGTMERGVAWVVDLESGRASRRSAPGYTFQGGWRNPGGPTFVGTFAVDDTSDVGLVAEVEVHTSSLSLRPIAPAIPPPSAIRGLVADAQELWAVTTYGAVYSQRLDDARRIERLAPMVMSESRGAGVYFTGADRAARPGNRRVQTFSDQALGFVTEFDADRAPVTRTLPRPGERVLAASGWGDDALIAGRFGVYRVARDGTVSALEAPAEATAATGIVELPGLALLLAAPGGRLVVYDLARGAFCDPRPIARGDLIALIALDGDTAAAVTRGLGDDATPVVWVFEVR